jgi:hypothetical protein
MTPSLWGLMNKLYRTQKTAELCLRLSETSADVIHCLMRLLSRNGIKLTRIFTNCSRNVRLSLTKYKRLMPLQISEYQLTYNNEIKHLMIHLDIRNPYYYPTTAYRLLKTSHPAKRYTEPNLGFCRINVGLAPFRRTVSFRRIRS